MKDKLAVILFGIGLAVCAAQDVKLEDRTPPPVVAVELSPAATGEILAAVLPMLATTNAEFRVRVFTVSVDRDATGRVRGADVAVKARMSPDALASVRRRASVWGFSQELRQRPVASVSGVVSSVGSSVEVRFE